MRKDRKPAYQATVPPFGAAFLLRVAGYLPFTNKELLQAIEHSNRSFEEIMDFLTADDSQE